MTIWVLAKIGWNPIDLFTDARAESAEGETYLEPGLFLATPLDTVSLGLGLVLGTAGLPHILMRFFTVPDAKAARVVRDVGDGADRRLLRDDHGARLRRARDPRPGRRGGRRARAATSRCPIAGRRARRRAVPGDHRGRGVRDDPRGGRRPRDLGVRRGRARRLVEHRPQRAATPRRRRSGWRRSRPWSIGAIAIAIAIIGGAGLNVSFMVGLAFAVAASANFPALLLALTLAALQHHRRGHRRAVRRDQLDRARDHQPDGVAGPRLRGRRARLVRRSRTRGSSAIPLGFIGCWLGTMLSARAGGGAHVRRALRALRDRPRRRGGHRPDAHRRSRPAAQPRPASAVTTP